VKRNARTTVKPMSTKPAVIDATGLILGRTASVVAKRLLQGETIVIETRKKQLYLAKDSASLKRLKLSSKLAIQEKAHFTVEDQIKLFDALCAECSHGGNLRENKLTKGFKFFLEYLKNIKTKKTQTIPDANAEKLRCPYIRVEELAKRIGWNPVGE